MPATDLTPQAQRVLAKRYLQDKETTWHDVCTRVSYYLGADQDEQAKFYDVMAQGLFLPNTPTLVNAGKQGGQLSACFVLPIQDSITSIFDTIKNSALIYKSGGGVGINFSPLRPEGSMVHTTNGVSSGPVSFMRVFDAATGQLKQGGVRRGAAMAILNVSHPDIIKFIKAKTVEGELPNFNISVGITDEFIHTLKTYPHEPWICSFNGKHYCIELETGNLMPEGHPFIVNEQAAAAMTTENIWDLIVEQAWSNGEPGIVFLDKLGPGINCTNPCGEQPLHPYEACVLGSIDVSKFANDEGKLHDMQDVVTTAVNMLNRIINIGVFPLPEITEAVQKSRRIGLGIMGFADLLLKLKVKYGSPQSFEVAEEISTLIHGLAAKASQLGDWKNEALTCIAPTGSLSILANCSAGIEPNFDWVVTHTRPDFPPETVIHPLARPYLLAGEPLPDYFVKSQEIPVEAHVKMQATFQKHFADAGVSKTINLPNSATKEDVARAYMLAYELGCKGITVYRDGSRKMQVLASSSSTPSVPKTEIARRPYRLDGHIYKLRIELGPERIENVYVVIGLLDGKPYELFVNGNIREVSDQIAQQIDTTTRLTSLALRTGAPIKAVIGQLERIPGGHIYSLPHKIAGILESYLPEANLPKCPDCAAPVRIIEGCAKCTQCGWSKCS